ncbi:hypothetical protein [Robbsia andropogonis]|uniref:hypothetical protein n=1 Tax=Robbsia andropogonis TaxID=28092 RepID=UPI00209E5E0F|nr:hypothetical protein [Robbsia andropogonis]MCP1121036.1 hypothetical protein [Robbsia andropogonis]MCP1130783.1 hypothetical protein [Robbsia andropogonis]
MAKEKVLVHVELPNGGHLLDDAFLARDTGEVYASETLEAQLASLHVDPRSAKATVSIGEQSFPLIPRAQAPMPGMFCLEAQNLKRVRWDGKKRRLLSLHALNKSQKDLVARALHTVSLASAATAVAFSGNLSFRFYDMLLLGRSVGMAVLCFVLGILIVKGD